MVTDVLGVAAVAETVTSNFPSDVESLGFRNNARFQQVQPVLAQQYQDGAELIAIEAMKKLTTLLPCAAQATDACARTFISTVVSKLYRRPLTQVESDRYFAAFTRGKTNLDFNTGITWVIHAALQSPGFLYRFEFDDTAAGQPVRPLAAYEMASRLSFLLWGSVPDDVLLTAASKNELATAAQVEAQARRMLMDPKAQRVTDFIDQWLDLDRLPDLKRDPTSFAGTDGIGVDLRQESLLLAKSVIFDDNGTLENLFTSPNTFVNTRLAKHYGLPAVTGTGFSKVAQPGNRLGIFMQGPRVVHDKEDRTSIVRRGLSVRTQLLCQIVPAPPNDVQLDLGPIAGNLTQAQKLEAHRANPTCAACHKLMDPLGAPFEGLDALARPRAKDEGGRDVVVNGEITGTKTVNGPVADAAAMMTKIAKSPELSGCATLQAFRWGYGRKEEAADACAREQLQTRFDTSGGNLKELFVALTQTDDFLFRKVTAP